MTWILQIHLTWDFPFQTRKYEKKVKSKYKYIQEEKQKKKNTFKPLDTVPHAGIFFFHLNIMSTKKLSTHITLF